MDKEELEGLKKYLKLEILANCKVINEQEQDEIKYLTKFDSVKELVEAHKKLEDGLISEEEFDKLHDKYRFMAASPEEDEFDEEELELVSNEVPIYSDEFISREALDEMVNNLDSDNTNTNNMYEELARYFKLDLLREKDPSSELDREIAAISSRNEIVKRIETARALLMEGQISKESYRALYGFYSSELENNIKN